MPAVYFNDLFLLAPDDLEWSKPNASGLPPSRRASMGVAYTAGSLYVLGGVNSTGVFYLIRAGPLQVCTQQVAYVTAWRDVQGAC